MCVTVDGRTGTIYKTRPQIEKETGATRVIDTDHSMIHEGCWYTAFRETTTIANSTPLYFEMITPDSFEVHLKDINIFAVGVPWVITILEAPACTTGAIQAYARNRNRADYSTDSLSGVVLKKNPTGVTGGTVVTSFYAGGGTGVVGTKSSASSKIGLELELKKSTTYIIKMLNSTGSANAISAVFDWYQIK